MFLFMRHNGINLTWATVKAGTQERGTERGTEVRCKLKCAFSLVPRPFPPPVFDRILYAKTEGEGLGERVTCATSGRREGRH